MEGLIGFLNFTLFAVVIISKSLGESEVILTTVRFDVTLKLNFTRNQREWKQLCLSSNIDCMALS